MEQRPKFIFPVSVRFSDTDANRHVFFANYLTYFDMALMAYLKAVGYSFDRLMQNGLNLYYVEALTRFKGSAYFDEVLDVYAEISRFGTTSFTGNFIIYENKTQRLVNSGYLAAVIVDVKNEKPTPIPLDFKNAVEAFENR
jgi:acyl-CoA thioester hydrolase